jgi:hypothetical protein
MPVPTNQAPDSSDSADIYSQGRQPIQSSHAADPPPNVVMSDSAASDIVHPPVDEAAHVVAPEQQGGEHQSFSDLNVYHPETRHLQ